MPRRSRSGSSLPAPPATPRHVLSLLGAALLLPLLVYGAVGFFTRYAADDYCTAGILRTEGLLGAQTWWYFGFSPRYAFSFAVSAVELLGLAIVPLLPTLAMLLWLLVLTWALSRFRHLFPRFGSMPVCLLVAALVVFAVLSTTPDIAQSLYWQTGMLTYLFPLMLLTLYAGWVATQVTRAVHGGGDPPPSLLVSGAIPFVAGGMSETYLALQGTVLFLAAAGCLLVRTPATRAALPHLAIGWATSVAALEIIQLSPTVGMREAGLKPPLELALGAAINTGWLFVVRFARHSVFTALLCLALPSVIGAGPAPDSVSPDCRNVSPTALARHLGVVGVGSLALIMACFFPAFFAQGGDPPARSHVVPDFVLVCFLVYAGIRLQPVLARLAAGVPRAAVALAMGALALTPVVTAVRTLPEVPAAADYAARWDRLDGDIRAARAAGATNLVVAQLPRALGQDYLSTSSRYWFNGCVARYYGLQSIAADQSPG